jgi:heme A synthase
VVSVIVFEEHSRLLLVLHLTLGAALVATATHLAVWTWRFWRGNYSRYKGARWLAWATAGLFATEILVGLIIYPTYKVRTRLEYLDNPMAIAVDYANRAASRERLEQRLDDSLATAPVIAPNPRKLEKVGRWFDVKEHWVAVGLALAVALALILSAWQPKRDGDDIARMVAGMALLSAATVWLAAVIGAVVTSYRSIGA